MAKYDVVIIGAGPGGYVAAIRAAQLGAKCAVIEREFVGGTCLNWGCIPSKALIKSGRVAALVRDAAHFGVSVTGATIDYAVMAARKDKVVSILRGGIESLFKARAITLVQGAGRLTSPTSVEVAHVDGALETLEARAIILATGSEPARPPVFQFDGVTILTSQDAVAKTAVGKSVIIIGGGFIGCEYAALYANLGLEVTVVELLDSILSTMDADVIKEISRAFRKRKIKVRAGVRVEKLAAESGSAAAYLAGGEKLTADFALVSVGRRPVTEGLGLAGVGVASQRGYVTIDERCRTSVPSIYAVGDITGKLQLAHVASAQGVVAAENITGHESVIDYSVVPACVFTDPEVASVGVTEKEAAEKGLETKVGHFPFRALGKAQAEGELDGLVKIIGDRKTGRILGCHIVGMGASELIAEAAAAMKLGATVSQLVECIHAHPTLPEAFKEALEDFEDRAIHLP
jgi:dihydrolipoamide dehydrogenase